MPEQKVVTRADLSVVARSRTGKTVARSPRPLRRAADSNGSVPVIRRSLRRKGDGNGKQLVLDSQAFISAQLATWKRHAPYELTFTSRFL